MPCVPAAQPACHGPSVKAKGLQAAVGAGACLGGPPLGWTGQRVISLTPFPVWKKHQREMIHVEGYLRGGSESTLPPVYLHPFLGSRAWQALQKYKAFECGLCDGSGPGGLWVVWPVLAGACPCGLALTQVSSPTEPRESFLRWQVGCNHSTPSSGPQAGYVMSFK